MCGGIINGILFSAEAILLNVQGVGSYRDKVVNVLIEPTNYQIRVGDLVWWRGTEVHWEGKSLPRWQNQMESCE